MRRRLLADSAISIMNATVTCGSKTYNATRQIATDITVTLNGNTLVKDTDYTVTDNAGGSNVGDYTVIVEGINNYANTATGTFTITKVTPTVTAPVPNSLTYNATPLTLTSNGSTNYGTLKYSLDSSTWSASVPSATNAGTYTVYYKVDGDSNVNDVAASNVSVTINKVTPTVTAPTAKVLTFNGSNQVLADNGSTNWGTIQYKLDSGSWGTSVPSASAANVTYVVYYKVVGDSNINDVAEQSILCSIAEKRVTTPTITLNPTSYTYNGSACQPTPTVMDGGTVIPSGEYATTYSNNVNAGTATVTISDNSGGNYYISGTTGFTISKANGSVTTAPTAKSLTYNGSYQELINAGSGTGTMYYDLNSGAWGTTLPSAIYAGSYAVGYYAAESTNYYQSGTGSLVASIGKASQAAPTAYGSTVNYGSTAVATASGGGGQGSIEWSNGNTRTAAGSQVTYARWTGNANYEASPWSNAATLTVNDPYNGYAYVDLGLPSGTKWAKYNVGSTTEIGAGNYYQYGKGASVYLQTYGTASYSGEENPLSYSVDTARQVMGGQWHMPTEDQVYELANNTTFYWTAINGRDGGKFVGSNGNYIFFPAVGTYIDNVLYGFNNECTYWSSKPLGSQAEALIITPSLGESGIALGTSFRDIGHPVRGVLG